MKSILTIICALGLGIIFVAASSPFGSANNPNTTKAFSDYLGNKTELNLKGQIVDHNNQPVENATISIGNTSVTTDAYGKFDLNNVAAHENLAAISVSKDGYKSEHVDVTPTDDTTKVNIKLHKQKDLSLFWFSKNNHNLPQITEGEN